MTPLKLILKPFSKAKEKAMQAVIVGILRHVATAAGGALVAKGWIDAAQNTELIGALLTLAGIAASVLAKRGK